MERLTEKTTDGILVKENYSENGLRTFYQCFGGKPNDNYSNCEEGYCAMEKLAAYEDAEEQGQYGKWIPVSERLPKPEEEVLVTAICRYKDGGCREIVIPAIYEDGAVLECNSNWYWEDIDGDWDEENDCLIIPEGWFEDRKYNPDCTYNCAIDDEVVAWMPKPKSYRESEE